MALATGQVYILNYKQAKKPNMKLSILVPSVSTRRQIFLPKIMDMLYGQLEALPAETQKQVEILCLVDNQTLCLGDKRNKLIEISRGEYIVFVDDDDRIEPTYITDILKAIQSNADVITFKVSVSLNGKPPKLCYYSKEYEKDYNTKTTYHRLPNHICVVKRELCVKVPFPSLKYAEDRAYAILLKPYLKTEHFIDKVLYHYDYSDATTIAQEDMPYVKHYKHVNALPVVDIVILSNGKTQYLRELTQQAVNTAYSGANGLKVNIIVIEQQPGVQYGKHAKLIYHPAPFAYNTFANLGARNGSAPNIMICNNDLTFKDGYLHSLLAANYPIVSPKCPKDPRQKDITSNETGYQCGKYFSGWAFLIKRTLWEKIGGFREDVSFWTADNIVVDQLEQIGIEPMLVPSAIVEHLQSATLKDVPLEERDKLTRDQVKLYNYIQGKALFNWKFTEEELKQRNLK